MSYWDVVADQYDDLYVDGYSRLEDRAVADLLQSHFIYADRVLDIGCGTGLGKTLLPDHIEYHGIDPSPTMLARACSRYPNSWFKLGRAEDIPHPSEAFDGAIALYTVWSLVEPAIALRELYRVTKPGSPVLLMGINRLALWRRDDPTPSGVYFTRKDPTDSLGTPARFYTDLEFKAALRPYFHGKVLPLSWFANVAQVAALWPLDRLLCKVAPSFAHNLIFMGYRHA